ncbi:DUF4249 family protein [Puia dinghuensis]|uniref:DUF4249 domain-containing protein n=1 Tax=Puia dinghuensis TaxID=1792502 RepID=A0A8J2UCS7_9BACT|nr:DUF4249 family protein [Puia dinghuensis]GGA99441.1 hypothetical protein GCM10011511_23440 [Puia dinghuensis]
MRRRNIGLLLILTVTVAACKKVINVNLNKAEPQIVIEGEVTNNRVPYLVRISKTVNFSASNVYPPVTGATVIITDSTAGVTEQLLPSPDSGSYYTRLIKGVPKHTYSLNVTVDGKQYTAVSRMPAPVRLDSVTFALNFDFSNKQEINAVVNFQDPPRPGNYYQFSEVVNGRTIPNVFVFENRLSVGRYIQQPLFNDSAYLQKNDTLILTMNCVDENIYNYFFTLANVTGNNNFQTATPANPVTNLSNGALGYFSAHTTQRMKMLIY